MIFLPWYYLSGLIFPMNIDLSIAYYRDMFESHPDLDPPVIIDEMIDKLRSIVDNYRPLPSTTSFDYLRFVERKTPLFVTSPTATTTSTTTISNDMDIAGVVEERVDIEGNVEERVVVGGDDYDRNEKVTGWLIEFIKYN